jgi:hypothetical protein
VPIGRPETFTVNNQKTYEILRFEGKGPTLAQTIAIAKPMRGKQMLTLKEAMEITGGIESNTAFRKALRPGEWGYVRDPESEGRSWAAYLGHDGVNRRLCAGDNFGPEGTSRVLILKVESKAPATQELRMDKGSANRIKQTVNRALELVAGHGSRFNTDKMIIYKSEGVGVTTLEIALRPNKFWRERMEFEHTVVATQISKAKGTFKVIGEGLWLTMGLIDEEFKKMQKEKSKKLRRKEQK